MMLNPIGKNYYAPILQLQEWTFLTSYVILPLF
jgi:hypothetical protein